MSGENDPDLLHFLSLANRGHLPGCSTGEHFALGLANAILRLTPGLDCRAITGAKLFLTLASVDNVGASRLVHRGRK